MMGQAHVPTTTNKWIANSACSALSSRAFSLAMSPSPCSPGHIVLAMSLSPCRPPPCMCHHNCSHRSHNIDAASHLQCSPQLSTSIVLYAVSQRPSRWFVAGTSTRSEGTAIKARPRPTHRTSSLRAVLSIICDRTFPLAGISASCPQPPQAPTAPGSDGRHRCTKHHHPLPVHVGSPKQPHH